MADIFEEVDESLRQDKFEDLWKRYQFFVYGAAGLLIAGVALNEFVLKPNAERVHAERALAFETAVLNLEEGDYQAAEAGLRELAEGNSKLAPLAAHFLAQTRYEGGGDLAGASSALAGVAGIEDGPYARLAILKLAYMQADNQDMAELEATLGVLVDDNGPLGALSRELIAAKAVATGDVERARTLFNRLRFDSAAPEGVRQRAEIALATLPATSTADTDAPIPATEDATP